MAKITDTPYMVVLPGSSCNGAVNNKDYVRWFINDANLKVRTVHRRTHGTVKQVARCQVQRITALLQKFNHVSAHQTRLRWLPAWVDLEKNLGGGWAKHSGHKSCSV